MNGRAGDNNQGCGRIDVFRVALESSKVALIDDTADLNNRPARYRTLPECNVGLGRATGLVMTCRAACLKSTRSGG